MMYPDFPLRQTGAEVEAQANGGVGGENLATHTNALTFSERRLPACRGKSYLELSK